jgi:hypothetical protein
MLDAPPDHAAEPLPGLRAWTNPRNGFSVLRIHYTADPDKRTPEWLEAARAGMPERGWRREYELDWHAPEGEPVLPEFDPTLHVRAQKVDGALRILRGWDFGYVTPAVVFCQCDPFGQLRVLDEVVPFNTPLDSLVAIVKQRTIDRFGRGDLVFDAGDPQAEAQMDTGSIRSLLTRLGVILSTSRPGTDVSYERLRARLRQSVYVPGVGQRSSFVVDPRCVHLIEALSGAFHLSDHPPYRPVKQHPYKDITDALRYLSDNLDATNLRYQDDIKRMSRADWAWT